MPFNLAGWLTSEGLIIIEDKWVQGMDHHINILELKTIYIAVKPYKEVCRGSKDTKD